jgi:hypothetical protein
MTGSGYPAGFRQVGTRATRTQSPRLAETSLREHWCKVAGKSFSGRSGRAHFSLCTPLQPKAAAFEITQNLPAQSMRPTHPEHFGSATYRIAGMALFPVGSDLPDDCFDLRPVPVQRQKGLVVGIEPGDGLGIGFADGRALMHGGRGLHHASI